MTRGHLKIACAGAGYFSQFHYDAWRRIEGVELVGAMALSKEEAATTGCPPFDDLDAMIGLTEPDVLDIITPPDTHLALITQAIKQGIKRIICQKPFCRTLNEASHVVQFAAEHNAMLVIHENFRFQPWYRLIKKEILNGLIGRLHQITFRLRTGDGQGPKAYLDRQPYFQSMPRLLVHETAVHWIDTFRYLAGDPVWVFSDLRTLNPVIAGEDAGYILFSHENGVRTLFDGNRHLDHAAHNHRLTLGECLVEGHKGTLSLSGDGSVLFRSFGSTSSRTLLAAQSWPGFAGDCVHAFQQHVANAIRNQGELENEAADYLRVLELEEAIYRSAENGCLVQV